MTKFFKDKAFEITVCHEWGHALTHYLMTCSFDSLETIEFKEVFFYSSGHTTIFHSLSQNLEQEILELFGGIAAENICGYSKVFLHKGTDADKLKTLVPNIERQKEYKNQVLALLMPYKEVLEQLTQITLADYTIECEREGVRVGYYRVFHDTIVEWITKAIKHAAH